LDWVRKVQPSSSDCSGPNNNNKTHVKRPKQTVTSSYTLLFNNVVGNLIWYTNVIVK